VSYLRAIAAAIRSYVPPERVPRESEDLFLSYAALALAKRARVTAEDVHNAWVAWMEGHGRQHGSMVPYKDLPTDVRREDDPFVSAIRRVARERL